MFVVYAGEKDVLLMANHGVLTVAPTISMAFDNLYYLERAAMVQVRCDIRLSSYLQGRFRYHKCYRQPLLALFPVRVSDTYHHSNKN